MAICLDTSIVIPWIDETASIPPDPRTGSIIPRARERIEAHIESLRSVRQTIIIPMPALAEVLSATTNSAWLVTLNDLSGLDLRPFGLREAEELARLNRRFGMKVTDRSRQAVKVDRQIVATALAASADQLYTMDDGMRRIAEQAGLTVLHVSDLPEAPATQQGLFSD